jgi:hypothetical protein
MVEVWKDVPNYEGIYQVSNLGRVKSLSRIKLNCGKYPFTTKEIILKQGLDLKGYPLVVLTKDNKRKTRSIHQLVAEAFLNHKPCGYELVIDHINDNPLDNRIENLQVVTQRFNTHKTQGKYTSKYKGVHWDKRAKKWKTSIVINGKTKHLGRFVNEYDAYIVYQNKLKEII